MPRPSLLATAVWAALAGSIAPGCALTEAELRHETAMEKLDGELPEQLDKLLERWSGAAVEANRTSEEIYRLRIERLLRGDDNLFAVRLGLRVSDEVIVATCAAAMGFAATKGVGAELVPLLTHDADVVRGNAAMALYLLGGRDCSIQDAMTALGDSDAGVREQGALLAARVLRHQADARKAGGAKPEQDDAYYGALLAYFESLSDVDEQVRVNVSQGLGLIGNPAAAAVLVERGLQDPSPRVRYTAAQALAELRPTSEAEAILEALSREFNQFVKRELHQTLRAITGLDIGSVDEWKRRLPEWRDEREGRARGKVPPPPPVIQPTPPGGGAAGRDGK